MATSFIIGRIRSTTSSRLTSSSTDIDSASCTSAIDDTRRTDSISASRPSALLVRLACSRSSAATVCRLFFTLWWISRMVASLDSSARSRRLISVTSRIRTAAPAALAVHHQRHRAQQNRRAARVDLHPHAGTADQRVPHVVGELLRLERVGYQWPGHRDEVLPLQLGGQAHAVVRGQRVRAGEHHDSGHVEPDESVTDAGAGSRDRQVVDVGEGALGEHVQHVARHSRGRRVPAGWPCVRRMRSGG